MQHHAILFNTMQYHAMPCNTMQYHAIPCNTMQYYAIPCNTMQYYAIQCNTMQYHAILCNAMQYHASLIIADGAYHCPVGSIMAIFILVGQLTSVIPSPAQACWGTRRLSRQILTPASQSPAAGWRASNRSNCS